MENTDPNVITQNQPPVSLPVNQPMMEESKNGGAGLWIVIGIVIVIILSGVAYWYLNGQELPFLSKPPTQSQSQTTSSQDLTNLKSDINSIATEDNSDFNAVDQDLQNL